MSTKFFTNRGGKSLFEKFKGIFEEMADLYAFYAVVAFFRSSGYFKIRTFLEKVPEIKILVGINVDKMIAEAQQKGLLFFGDDNKTKEEFIQWFIEDIQEAEYEKETEEGIIQFVQDIIDGKIEVRAHKSRKLHSKFYLFLPERFTPNTDGRIIMGSSNLTEQGLGAGEYGNYEMNVELKDYDDVNFGKKEFEFLWNEAVPILPEDAKKGLSQTHLAQSFTPYELYLKLLIEYFGENINFDPDSIGDLPKGFKKLSYQVDAVNQGFKMLKDHNGFFLADVVGLGKTVMAAMTARRFLLNNGIQNTKILVVYPPAVEHNWKETFKQFGIDKYTKFITNGSLHKIINGDNLNYWPKEEYDLIIVDEAHEYRNPSTEKFRNLQLICKTPRKNTGYIKGDKKKVILVTATPLNNTPADLYHQLLLFQDARQSTLPETNLQAYFAPRIKRYKEIVRSENPNMDELQKLYDDIRQKIIYPITIRRTRKDLQNYPQYMEDLKNQGIRFPEVAPLEVIKYEMDEDLEKLFFRTVEILAKKLGYYRYQAIKYLKKPIREKYYDQAESAAENLAGIIKTFMVKRLESSFYAFKISLNSLLEATKRMIDMFEKDKIIVAPDMYLNELYEKNNLDKVIKIVEERISENERNRIFSKKDFKKEFEDKLKKDYELLQSLNEEWKKINYDPKFEKFIEKLNHEFFNPDKNPSGLLIIFTESNDTAEYLNEQLKHFTNKGILKISGANRNKLFKIIRENFDANYTGTRKNDYHILITTDVLAEGVNLHRANVIVNYDTPWNPTRLIQRTGRINRIGTPNKTIYSYVFYPSDQGNEIIRLKQRALVKMQAFHTAYGSDNQIFSPEEIVRQYELYRKGEGEEEDERLLYLREIREFKDRYPRDFNRLAKLPVRARTGRANNEKFRDGSVVFLRSPYKLEFYSIDQSKRVESLSFLKAVEIFKAPLEEKSIPLPPEHHEQIKTAVDHFVREFLEAQTPVTVNTEQADRYTKTAKKFLRELLSSLKSKDNVDKSFIKALEQMKKLVSEGTYVSLAKEISKIVKEFDKKKIDFFQVEEKLWNLIIEYDILAHIQKQRAGQEEIDFQSIHPQIIISETFGPK